MERRVFLDVEGDWLEQDKKPVSDGYFARCFDLHMAIQRAEEVTGHTVIGIVYEGGPTVEMVFDPPLDN